MISISVVIPTIGRQTLIRTLDAIASQVTEADEVIVVADANRPIGETFHAAQDRYRYPSWQWRSLAFVDSFKGFRKLCKALYYLAVRKIKIMLR